MNDARRHREAGSVPAVPRDGSPPTWQGTPSVEAPGAYKEGVGYALWCLIFLGLGGVHRIYVGKYGTGILWILTWGLFGIGQFLDLFRIKGLVREANVREGYLPHPRQMANWTPPPGRVPPAEPDERQAMKALLAAAERHGGRISVTQGVAATGLSFSQVESALREMVVEGYVDVDNEPRTGVVVYRFPELEG